jgi:predicted membrane-bound spermidine synthase
LSCLVGYISLSQEILWVRAIAYATGGKPDVFGHVLGVFLMGIAFGSLFAQLLVKKYEFEPLLFVAGALCASSIVYFLSLPMAANASTLWDPLGVVVSFAFLFVIALLSGGIFPVLCEYGIQRSSEVGTGVSWVYAASILGSTAGPLVTGFVLLDSYGLGQLVVALSVLTLVLSVGVFLHASRGLAKWRPLRTYAAVAAAIVVVLFLILGETMNRNLLAKLHMKDGYDAEAAYAYLVQNRSGVIATAKGKPDEKDALYGGGVYDGRFNADPCNDCNWITRAYFSVALHREPREVLEIGLGSGSWACVIASHEAVGKLTVVEINPGYPEVISRYPEVAGILDDPKVRIVTDDGRRWLNRHPDELFDLIVMNTSFHWRSQMTNLLSLEFLRLAKQHLKPGGVLYFNSTFSKDVPYTAAHAFQHVTMFGNFVAASDRPFDMGVAEREANLLRFRGNDGPVFRLEDPASRKVLEKLAAFETVDLAPRLRGDQALHVITDDNMFTEYKAHREIIEPRARWSRLLRLPWS